MTSRRHFAVASSRPSRCWHQGSRTCYSTYSYLHLVPSPARVHVVLSLTRRLPSLLSSMVRLLSTRYRVTAIVPLTSIFTLMILRVWLASDSFPRISLNRPVCLDNFMRHFIRSCQRSLAGDTLGGIGSAIAMKRGTFKQNKDGTFTGTLVVQPDRGFNM